MWWKPLGSSLVKFGVRPCGRNLVNLGTTLVNLRYNIREVEEQP